MPPTDKLLVFFAVFALGLGVASWLVWAKLSLVGHDGRRQAGILIGNMWGTAAVAVALAYCGGRAIGFDLPRYLEQAGTSQAAKLPIAFALAAVLVSGILLVRLLRLTSATLGFDMLGPPQPDEELPGEDDEET